LCVGCTKQSVSQSVAVRTCFARQFAVRWWWWPTARFSELAWPCDKSVLSWNRGHCGGDDRVSGPHARIQMRCML